MLFDHQSHNFLSFTIDAIYSLLNVLDTVFLFCSQLLCLKIRACVGRDEFGGTSIFVTGICRVAWFNYHVAVRSVSFYVCYCPFLGIVGTDR